MMQQPFNPNKQDPLNLDELNMFAELKTCLDNRAEAMKRLNMQPHYEFTVDMLRTLGFDKQMKKDSKKRTNFGTLVFRWKYWKLIEDTGRSESSKFDSNHGHRIQVWKLKQ